MSITPDEQKQFSRIVAGFDTPATQLTKKMKRRERASEMTFIPMPSLLWGRDKLITFLLIVAIISPPASMYLIKVNMGVSLLALAISPIALVCAMMLRPGKAFFLYEVRK